MKKSNIVERAELIIEIQIERRLILSIALPAKNPWIRENTYTQGFFPANRPFDTLSFDLLPYCLEYRKAERKPKIMRQFGRSWELKSEKSEYKMLFEITLYQTIKELREA